MIHIITVLKSRMVLIDLLKLWYTCCTEFTTATIIKFLLNFVLQGSNAGSLRLRFGVGPGCRELVKFRTENQYGIWLIRNKLLEIIPRLGASIRGIRSVRTPCLGTRLFKTLQNLWSCSRRIVFWYLDSYLVVVIVWMCWVSQSCLITWFKLMVSFT